MLTDSMIARGDINITFRYFLLMPPIPPTLQQTGHAGETANSLMTPIRL
jgi:hypothetical protein